MQEIPERGIDLAIIAVPAGAVKAVSLARAKGEVIQNVYMFCKYLAHFHHLQTSHSPTYAHLTHKPTTSGNARLRRRRREGSNNHLGGVQGDRRRGSST